MSTAELTFTVTLLTALSSNIVRSQDSTEPIPNQMPTRQAVHETDYVEYFASANEVTQAHGIETDSDSVHCECRCTCRDLSSSHCSCGSFCDWLSGDPWQLPQPSLFEELGIKAGGWAYGIGEEDLRLRLWFNWDDK